MPRRVALTSELQYIHSYFSGEWDNTWIRLSCAPGKNAETYLLRKLCEYLWEEYEDAITSWYENERKGETPSPDDKTFLDITIVEMFEGGYRLSRSFIDAAHSDTA